jgi:hypothetical protein
VFARVLKRSGRVVRHNFVGRIMSQKAFRKRWSVVPLHAMSFFFCALHNKQLWSSPHLAVGGEKALRDSGLKKSAADCERSSCSAGSVAHEPGRTLKAGGHSRPSGFRGAAPGPPPT